MQASDRVIHIEMSEALGPGVCQVSYPRSSGRHVTRTTKIVRTHDMGQLLMQDVISSGGQVVTVDLLSSMHVAAIHDVDTAKRVYVVSRPPGDLEFTVLAVNRHGDYSPTQAMIENMPPLVGAMRFTAAGALEQSWLFLAQGMPVGIEDTCRIMPWPFGNVYAEGVICWGQVNPNVYVANPIALFEQFQTSIGNTDLWRGDGLGITRPVDAAALQRMRPAGTPIVLGRLDMSTWNWSHNATLADFVRNVLGQS